MEVDFDTFLEVKSNDTNQNVLSNCYSRYSDFSPTELKDRNRSWPTDVYKPIAIDIYL